MKTRNLNRLKEKVFNNPLLMTETSLIPITSYLRNPERNWLTASNEVSDVDKLLSEFEYTKSLDSYEERQLREIKQRAGINPDTNIGYIDVSGTLVAKAGNVNGCVELTSYEKIKKLTKMQIQLGASSITYVIDSNGGEAYLAFSTARDLRKMADDAGIKTRAYVDGSACSAAYMMASASHEIVSNEDSEVGSIGVLVQLINPSKHLEQQGIERTFITAGEHKVPFEDDGSFNKEFLDRIQTSVSKTYDKFVSTVADLRQLPKDKIIDTQARVYSSDEALSLGLIDKIMEFEDFEKYISSSPIQTTYVTTLEHNKETITMSDTKDNKQLSVETLQAQLTALETDKQSLSTQLQGLQTSLSEAVVAKEQAETALANFKSEAKQEARVAKLAEVFGTDSEKPQMYATMFASLDDVAFDKVATDFKASVDKQEKEMEEVGHSAKTETIAKTEEEQLIEQAKARKLQAQ
ncbi:MAG: S49 family peptidase [Bacilli bacterium]